jgi:hypothetical protein
MKVLNQPIMGNFFREIYEAFRRVNGYAFGLLGVILTTICYIWLPNKTISFQLLVPFGLFVLLLILTFVDCSYNCWKRLSNRLPRVIRSLPPSSLYPGTIAILFVDRSDFFSHDSTVSVYSNQKDFELLIGIGVVNTVQQNGLIQVSVKNIGESNSAEIWKHILENNKDELESVMVKPSIPSFLVQR